MDPQRWARLQELFEIALELPPEHRRAWLEGACPDDPDLCRQAESLILHDGEPTSAGEAVRNAALQFAAGAEPQPGERFGPYRILELLGRGGMGAVFLAERDDDQFRQTVAIKLVRSSLPSPETLARFKAERQILAQLNHPHIARLLDGGTARNGTPYFVIEHIDGEPITDYCNQRGLGIEDRLRLVCKVCSAVQYSHQNLVVHRDLKPGNILVTAKGEPKLLDFGIAKLLDPAASTETQTQLRLMTPDYASPEQVRGQPVTTATDVYALGVLLYELLAGERPFRVRSTDSYAMEQAICTQEPTRPSAIRRELRGDLENIVLMAMRKEPSRRYASAEQLSEDLRRYLEGYPVKARQDTRWYRAAKFVRRNRWGVAAAGAFVVLTAAFAVAMAVQFNVISTERDRASLEQRKAEQVAAFMASLFRVADPNRNKGETITAREILDQGAARLDRELGSQPRVQAMMLHEVGSVYASLGLYQEALKLLERTVAIRLRVLGEMHADTAASLERLAWVRRDLGDYEGGLRDAERCLAIRRALFGEQDPGLAPALNAVAVLREDKADYTEAEALHKRAIALLRQQAEPNPQILASALQNLAGVLNRQGKYDQIESLLTDALAIRRRALGDDHPDVSRAMNNLADHYLRSGKLDRADQGFREVLALRRKVLGADHPDVAKVMVNLASVCTQKKQFDEAVELLNGALGIFRERLGEKHLNTAFVMDSLANLHYAKHDYKAAEALYLQSMEMFRERFGGDHPEVAVCYYNLAGNFEALEKYREAEVYARRAEEVYRTKIGPDSPQRLNALVRVGDALLRSGRAAAAAGVYRQALDTGATTWKADADSRIGALIGLGSALTEVGKAAEAEPLLREALKLRRDKQPADGVEVAHAEGALGDCLRSLGRHPEAVPLLQASLRSIREEYGDQSPVTRLARTRLARVEGTAGAAR